MYSIPDRLEVKSSDGQTLFTTGGLVSGSDTVQVTYSGGRMVYVTVTAPTSGTAWDYTIGCPSWGARGGTGSRVPVWPARRMSNFSRQAAPTPEVGAVLPLCRHETHRRHICCAAWGG